MKNLKDYFSSPSTPDEQTPKTSPVLVKSVSGDCFLLNKLNSKIKKKPRKKSSSAEIIVEVDDIDIEDEDLPRKRYHKKRKANEEAPNTSVDKRKKKKSIESVKTCNKPRKNSFRRSKSEESSDVGSKSSPEVIGVFKDVLCERNITKNTSDLKTVLIEECEKCLSQVEKKDNTVSEDLSPIQDKKSLLNYFNKVEKTFPIKEDIKKITVQCLVHTPPKVKQAKRLSQQLNTEKTPGGKESDCKESVNRRWKMRISLSGSAPSSPSADSCASVSDDDIAVLEEVSKPKKDSKSKSGITNPNVISIEDSSNSSDVTNCKNLPESDVTVIDDDSNIGIEDNRLNRPKLRSGNLAAYFGLKTPHNGNGIPKLTSKQTFARNLFLQSPAPDSVRKLIGKSSDECERVEAPFPKQNHTRQVEKFNIIWNLDKMLVRLPTLRPVDQRPPAIPVWSTLNARPPPPMKVLQAPKIPYQEGLPVKAWKKGLTTLKNINKDIDLWTNRYCPSTCTETLLNGTVVDKLSEWLAAASHTEAAMESDSSSNEFEDSRNSVLKRAGNTALLIGPPGCGKTAAVYAAAKHNQYQVLELNASCVRSGKKILAEFSEATQSHKVETKSLLKVKKSKKKSSENNKKSLILIEDADIILDGVDEGYANGLASLQMGSKRPLLLVVNSFESAKHIQRLPVSLTLNLKHPEPSILSEYLMTLATVEKMKNIDKAWIESLLDRTKCDLRRSVLSLQLGCVPTPCENNLRNSLSSFCTEKRMDKSNISTFVRMSKALASLDIMAESCKEWNSDYSSIDGRGNQPSGFEDFNQLLSDISSVLLSLIALKSSNLTPSEKQSIRSWRVDYENQIGEGSASLHCVSRRAISLDYMSSMREIARAECQKLENHTRRSARLLSRLSQAGLSIQQKDMEKLVSSLSPSSCKIDSEKISVKT